MIFEQNTYSSHLIFILIWFISVSALILYIIILRRKLKIYNQKRSLISTKEEIRKIFSLEDNEVIKIKRSGRESAKRFDLATVLFSDIQGFTKIAEQLNPESLIDELDIFFYHFDTVVEKYNIEKIKTIGDAYMCAGGIPHENHTNPVEVVLAALEMQLFMKNMKHHKGEMWDLRIGIHTGSVIAGVVGHKKLSYDIWGDTVNTASRMESSCTPGKINISGHTYDFIKDYFICEYRGKMPVKYKGNIDMYYVNGIKPDLEKPFNKLPISKLDIKLQTLRIFDLENYILEQFEKYNNPDLTFHNLKNTVDLYIHTDLFSRAEKLPEWENIIVLTAALLINIGYLIDYENHIDETIRLTKSILPKFKYIDEQIEEICNLINTVEKNETVTTITHKILFDARYSYIGRVDYIDVITEMYKEAKHFSSIKFDQWQKQQINILENFSFYTRAANTLREEFSDEQIKKIKKMKL